MGHLFLAIFLIIFGLNLVFALGIPPLVLGLLALTAGVLLIVERTGVRIDRK